MSINVASFERVLRQSQLKSQPKSLDSTSKLTQHSSTAFLFVTISKMFALATIVINMLVLLSKSSSVNMPPDGTYIQFQNVESNKCMLDRELANGNIDGNNGVTDSCCINCDDQLYKLEPHATLYGYYKLVNVKSNRVIISSSDGSFRTYPNIGTSADKYWKFEAKSSDANLFKLVNLESKRVIVSNSDGRYTTYPNIGSSDDKYWKWNIENYNVIGVSFDLNNGNILSDAPLVAGGGICNNGDGGSESQTVQIESSITVTETSSFSYTAGFSLSIGTTFETGIPFVAAGQVSTTLTVSHELSFGSEFSTERTFTAILPVTCASGEIIEVECVVFQAQLNVPYTLYLRADKSGSDFESNGIWTGTSAYEFICDFDQIGQR